MDPILKCCADLEEKWKPKHVLDKQTKPHSGGGSFLPLTELAVDLTNEFVANDLGRVDMYTASEFFRNRSLSSSTPLVTGLLYSRRWCKKQKLENNLHACTSAELFLVSMMVASKYLYDEGTRDDVFNDEWAEDFPGMETEDLNRLESEFLNHMDWDLFVRPAEFYDFLNELEIKMAESIVRNRNWQATFKEMQVLLSSQNLQASIVEVVKLLVEAMSILMLVYACTLLSVYTSVVVVRFAHPAISNHFSRTPLESPRVKLSHPVCCHNCSCIKYQSARFPSDNSQIRAFPVTFLNWTPNRLFASLSDTINQSLCWGLSRPAATVDEIRLSSVNYQFLY